MWVRTSLIGQQPRPVASGREGECLQGEASIDRRVHEHVQIIVRKWFFLEERPPVEGADCLRRRRERGAPRRSTASLAASSRSRPGFPGCERARSMPAAGRTSSSLRARTRAAPRPGPRRWASPGSDRWVRRSRTRTSAGSPGNSGASRTPALGSIPNRRSMHCRDRRRHPVLLVNASGPGGGPQAASGAGTDLSPRPAAPRG